MTGAAVLTAARGGAARRLVQSAVVLVVLAAGVAAGTLGLTLAAIPNEGFYAGFAAAHGADLAVTINAAKVTSAQLAATRQVPGVTQTAGPYPETYITYTTSQSRSRAPGKVPSGHSRIGAPGQPTRALTPGHSPHSPGKPGRSPRRNPAAAQPSPHGNAPGPLIPRGQVNPAAGYPGEGLSVVSRASTGGRLDHLTLLSGRWATRPGEIVLSNDRPVQVEPGGTISVTSAPGKPTLKVVGIATSITVDQRDWVTPSQLAALRPKGAPVMEQMLYTFTHSATTAQVNADLAGLRHALPAGAVINWTSWLTTLGNLAASDVNTPLAVAYGIIAVVLAVLITATVASAAVVAGYRRIGVLKSIGFTPAQVGLTYLAQIGAPALAGAIAGAVLGNYWVAPLLGTGVPLWVSLSVPAGMLALTGLAALVPALRAGRLPAVAAIAAGQAPRAGHGYAAHRLAARLALPRPVTLGLAAPFTRPARSAAMLAALTFGLTAVVLAAGLDSAIAKIDAATTQWQQTVLTGAGNPPGKQAITPSQQQTVTTALRAQPGTLAYLGEASGTVSVPGAGSHLPVTAYSGDASQLGWDITSGTWYTGPGQVVVNTARRDTAGLRTGQIIRMTTGRTTITARITGEVYAPAPSPVLGALLTSQQTFARAGASLPVRWYQAALKPGISQQTYSAALQRALGPKFGITAISIGATTGANHDIHGVGYFELVDTSLIRLLTIMIAVLAGLGVLNSVLMLTRERVHDLGIFKAVGMTPWQDIAMVTCWAVAPALGAAVIGLPAGMALQGAVIHAIASVQAKFVPGGVVHVYTAAELTLLGLAGLLIAIIGALGPASWAAASPATTALHTE